MLGRLAKDMAIYGAGDLVFKFVAFAVFPIYAHLFKVEQFGVMELVNTLATLVSLFLGLGITSAVQRFYWDPQFPEAKRSALISTGLHLLMGWSILFAVFIVFILFPFQGTDEGGIWHSLGLFWFLLVQQCSTSDCSVLSRCSAFPFFTLAILDSRVRLEEFFGCCSWPAFHLGHENGTFGILSWNFFSRFRLGPVRSLVNSQGPQVGFRQAKSPSRSYVFSGIRSRVCWIGLLVFRVHGSMDVGDSSDNTQVGLFSIAFKFASLLFFVNFAFGQAWSPFAIKIYADRPDYRRIFTRALSWLLLGLTLIGVTLTLFAQELLFSAHARTLLGCGNDHRFCGDGSGASGDHSDHGPGDLPGTKNIPALGGSGDHRPRERRAELDSDSEMGSPWIGDSNLDFLCCSYGSLSVLDSKASSHSSRNQKANCLPRDDCGGSRVCLVCQSDDMEWHGSLQQIVSSGNLTAPRLGHGRKDRGGSGSGGPEEYGPQSRRSVLRK